MMKQPISAKKILTFTSIGLLGLIVVTELFLRYFYAEKLSIHCRPAVYNPLPIVNYGYTPDTTFTLSGKNHYINKQGFIGDDFGEKTNDTFRIAIVGSSTVAGSINLKAYYSFCPILQQKFIDTHSHVKILNCGIDGSERSLDLFKSIRYQITGLNPDMIFFEYGLPFRTSNGVRENYKGYIIGYPAFDSTAQAFCKNMVDTLTAYQKYIDFLYHSYIIRASVYLYYHRPNSNTKLKWYIDLYQNRIFIYGNFKLVLYTMEESIQMVQDLKNELNDADIDFFLFQIGEDDSIIQMAKKNQLPLVTLRTSFSENDYFLSDSHWNELGCKKVADRFYDLMIKHQLIPK